jgi:uncharacterized protein YutE (UPF0331/DUF86 family)
MVDAELIGLKKSRCRVEMVKEKISELSRPTFYRRLLHRLRKLKVELKDIGGEAGLRQMIAVRNGLIHTTHEPPIEKIDLEASRVETVVERLLLRILGWTEKSHTPTPTNRRI